MANKSIQELISEAVRALGYGTPLGADVPPGGDYGRADGLWHKDHENARLIYAVETSERPNVVDALVKDVAAHFGLGLILFDECAKCGTSSALLPIYGKSGGFAGVSIFYLTMAEKASE